MCHLPQLFNILLELVMLMALDDTRIGACIQGEQINNLRFADDIVLIAETPEELQTLVNRVYESSSDYGLKINIAKTEVQVISKGKCELSITINNNRLKQVEVFVYLGGTIADNGSSTNDIKTRIRKAGAAFQRLNSIWTSKNINNHTKRQLYQTLILSILLYGAESWTMKKDDENRLHVFEMTCLRRILGVTRLDKIRNTKIKESLNLDQDVLNRIVVKRLKYFGHINRMQNTRYPKRQWKAMSEATDPEVARLKDGLTASPRTAKQGQ